MGLQLQVTQVEESSKLCLRMTEPRGKKLFSTAQVKLGGTAILGRDSGTGCELDMAKNRSGMVIMDNVG